MAHDKAGSQNESRILSGVIIAHLRQAILSGDYAPGTRVRQKELADIFGTSRIPVREALKELEVEGLITLVPNSGAWISKLDSKECDEIYKIRERIEPLALKESILNMSAGRIDQLSELVDGMENSKSLEEFLRIDRLFHISSYADAGLPTLLMMIERFWNTTQHYRRAYTKLIGDDGQWIIHAEHRLMLEAIKRRDVEEAERIHQGHIRRTRLQFNEFFKVERASEEAVAAVRRKGEKRRSKSTAQAGTSDE